MRIGIDIDGVMYQFDKTARYMLREILPDSPYKKDGPLGIEAQSWTYISDNISKEHERWLWTKGVKLGLFRHGGLYSGTAKAMAELAALGDVVIVTHRPRQAVNDTLAWLSYHKFDLSGVYIFSHLEPKSQVKCDVYLDDKPENCIDLLANTDGVVALMDRPWNQVIDLDRGGFYCEGGSAKNCIQRVHNWQEFIEIVRAK